MENEKIWVLIEYRAYEPVILGAFKQHKDAENEMEENGGSQDDDGITREIQEHILHN